MLDNHRFSATLDSEAISANHLYPAMKQGPSNAAAFEPC